MRTIILGLLFILSFICSSAYSAELLICAKDSPFETGCKTGDILVVRPDGHVWGNAECPPDYIVVKSPSISYEEAKSFEESLMVDDGFDLEGNPKQKMARLRKNAVDIKTAKDGKITMSKSMFNYLKKVKTE